MVASVEPLIGLGDEAGLGSASPATLFIYVRKKGTVFRIQAMGNATQKPSLDEMKSLAKRVVDQL